MPWMPELFSERVLEEWRERHAREKIVDVPYYDGLLADQPDALARGLGPLGACLLYWWQGATPTYLVEIQASLNLDNPSGAERL